MTIRKDKKFKHAEAMRSISRPPSTLSKQVKKRIVDDFYNKSFPAAKEKAYYDLAKPKVTQDAIPAAKERLRNYEVAGIKDSALYKLLQNPKVLGVELGHDTIMEVIHLIQNSGLVKKPEKEIDHIAFLDPKEIL